MNPIAEVATWDAIKEVSEQKVLSKEEQARATPQRCNRFSM
jgi:hypothetical protein